MKTMSIRLSEDLHQQLVAQANDLGIGPSVLARAILKSALDDGVDLMISPSLPEEERVEAIPRPSKSSGSSKGRNKKRRK